MSLKSWDQLSESRRGWAVGSIVGLLASLFYYSFYGQMHAQFLFYLAATPALPGVVFADRSLVLVLPWVPMRHLPWLRFMAVAVGTALNYLFWASYFALVYRQTERSPKARSAVEISGALGFLFFGLAGLSYAFSRGLRFEETHLPVFAIAVLAFFITLIGFALLFPLLVNLLCSREKLGPGGM